MKKQMDIRRIVYDALFAAMSAALGYFSFDFGSGVFKITFENIPILIGAMMFGPADGGLIGFVGIFLAQLLKYGLDPSTPLWILPYVLSGLVVGLIAKKKNFTFKKWEIVLLMLLNGVVVTSVNTLGLIVDAKFIRVRPLATVIAAIPVRFGAAAINAILRAILVPLIIEGLQKAGLYNKKWMMRS